MNRRTSELDCVPAWGLSRRITNYELRIWMPHSPWSQDMGVLYESLDFNNRRSLLKEIVERVVVDQRGNIKHVEWHSPFAYIRHMTERTWMELAGDRHETSRTMTAGANCSDWFSACGPEETRTLDLYSAIVALSQLSYRPLLGCIVMLGKHESQGGATPATSAARGRCR